MSKSKKSNIHQAPPPAVLTEAGIVVEGGETIRDGNVVDMARKASSLLNLHKNEEFMELMTGVEYDSLNKKDRRILLATYLPGRSANILVELCRIEDDSYDE